KKLLADLDNAKFEVREKATRMLGERFEIYKDLIQLKRQDPSISLETQNRLDQILAGQADAQRVSQAVAALNLSEDAAYLVSLFEHVPAEAIPRFIGHLEKVTGQKLGSDPATWKAWVKNGRK